MKRITKVILLSIAMLLLIAIPVFAQTYSYRAPYTVTDGAEYSMLGVTTDANCQWMADNGFMEASAMDSLIETLGGLIKPGMIVTDRINTALPIPESSQTNYYLTTGNSLVDSMDIIPADGGYNTIADSLILEPLAGAFHFELGEVYIDTSAGVRYLLRKDGAMNIADDGTLVNVNLVGIDADCLDYVRANNDWTRVPDDPAFSFTDGAGNDEPFTLIAWVNFDDITNGTVMSKVSPANYEWYWYGTAANLLDITLFNLAAGTNISCQTVDLSGDEGTWHHYAATYDATELNTGLEIYRDGVNATNARGSAGAYVGMDNGTSVVQLGAYANGTAQFLEGQMAEVKVYDVELTPGEILTDFNGGHKTTDLVAYWMINEGAGLPQDSSGNAHHANQNLADWVNTFTDRISTFLSATVLTSGFYDVELIFDGVNMDLDIDSVTEDTAAWAGTIVNTANDWILMEGTPSLGYYRHGILGVIEAWYQPNYMIENTGLEGTETAGGSDVTLTAVEIVEGVDYWVGARVIITSAGGVAPEDEISIVTASAVGSVTISPALTVNIDIGDTYSIDFGTLVDRSMYSLAFDAADDNVNCGADATMDIITTATLAAWVYIVSDGENNQGSIIDRRTGGGAGAGYKLLVSNEAAGNVAIHALLDCAVQDARAISLVDVTVGEWHRIVAVYDRLGTSHWELYVDGTIETLGTDTDGQGAITAHVANSLYVGDGAGSNYCFDGRIDEVQFYDRAWTDVEVLADYNGGVGSYVPDDSTDLQVELHLELGTGAVVTDTSGNGNNGAITNASWADGFVERTAGLAGTFDARITWGVNPTGIVATLGSFVSSSTPTPDPGVTAPAIDYLPASGGGDWDVQPAVTGALLTNPLRPFVTFMSDTTTISELQAWRFLGFAFVVFVFILAVKWSRHLVITFIATGGAVIFMVALTIWPWYALLLLGVGGLAILISERSPSV